MSRVHVLPGSPVPGYEPVPEVVEHLEELLAQAKRGEVRALAVVSVEPDGGVNSRSTTQGHFWKLLGGLTVLQHRMINE